MNDEPRDAIVCEECGRALAGVVELVDHYVWRHEHQHDRILPMLEVARERFVPA